MLTLHNFAFPINLLLQDALGDTGVVIALPTAGSDLVTVDVRPAANSAGESRDHALEDAARISLDRLIKLGPGENDDKEADSSLPIP